MKHLFLMILLTAGCPLAVAQLPLACGVNDTNPPDSVIQLMRQAPQLLASQRARQAAAPQTICRLAVEIDSDTYLQFNKDTNQIRALVLKQVSATSQIYEREINTKVVVVRIHIWKDTDPDPYRGEFNIFSLLYKMNDVWSAGFREIPYDKATYLFTKPVTGASGVALGVPGTINVSPLGAVNTLTHELGHNFGSVHTHNCNWPGGPIDFCANIEGNCYSASLENTVGTIMSYCAVGGVPMFHPLCRAVMTDHAEATMGKLTSAPNKAPVLPTQLTLPGRRYLYWDGQPLAERYDIDISETADFTTKLISDTTGINGYDLTGLPVNKPVFVRVRAVNRLGTSGWSGVLKLSIVSSPLPAPVLVLPTQNQLLVPPNEGTFFFSVEPVAGATAYEIQLTNSQDENFVYGQKSIHTSPFIQVQFGIIGAVRWRVRALFGNEAGPWSADGFFFVNANASALKLFAGGQATTFPFSYQPIFMRLPTTVLVATDPQFAQPVFQKTLLSNPTNGGLVTAMLELRPNTQYYVKVEEINSGQEADFPLGALSRLVQTFRTGPAALPPQWSFINSGNYPDLPQGPASSVKPTADALWVATLNSGLFRIGLDSLSGRLFNRTTTNGKMGGLSLKIAEGKPNEVWIANAVSQYGGGIPGSLAIQVSRIAGASGELTEQTVLRSEGYYFDSFATNPQFFFGYKGIYAPKDKILTDIYNVPANRFTAKQLTSSGLVWMIQFNTSNFSTELVRLNLLTNAVQTFSAQDTPQLGRTLNDMVVDGLGNLWVSQTSTTYPASPVGPVRWPNLDRLPTGRTAVYQRQLTDSRSIWQAVCTGQCQRFKPADIVPLRW